MPELVTRDLMLRFMRSLGESASDDTACYLTGGSTAVLVGWREATRDIDLRLDPDRDELLRRLQELKRELRVNVETASPADFIPVPAGWEERSPFVAREGRVTFRHFDPYAQALAKIERGHDRDRGDVAAMLERGLVEPDTLRRMYSEIEPLLYRFPALDGPSFRRKLDAALEPS